MVEPIFDYQFRLILIGDSTVGKSSLLKYFTDGKFSDDKFSMFIFIEWVLPVALRTKEYGVEI
jgi:GTPase SAR1 family protein